MKCAYHPNIEAESTCAVCSRPICPQCTLPWKASKAICVSCAGKEYATDGAQKREEAENKREAQRKKKQQPRAQVAVIVICLTAIALLIALFDPTHDEPFVIDTSDPEALAGHCLGTLSQAAELIPSGQLLSAKDVEDVCLPPLFLYETDNEVIVTAPDGTGYGFSKIIVRRDDKVVEVTD
ncbi:MAG: hypothetical protein GQ470_06075 [Gammaproteobacteria bacterium]|nr:hypothetical protein [Gammaproteobacteria bacterium]